MNKLRLLKTRFPKLFSAAAFAVTVGSIGGVAAYERSARAAESCCYPGSPCCYAGSPCCGQRHVEK